MSLSCLKTCYATKMKGNPTNYMMLQLQILSLPGFLAYLSFCGIYIKFHWWAQRSKHMVPDSKWGIPYPHICQLIMNSMGTWIKFPSITVDPSWFGTWYEPTIMGAFRAEGEVQEATLGVSEDWKHRGKEGPRVNGLPALSHERKNRSPVDGFFQGGQGGALVSCYPISYSYIMCIIYIYIYIYCFSLSLCQKL